MTASHATCWWGPCAEPPSRQFLIHSNIAAIFAPDGCGVLDIVVCERHARSLGLIQEVGNGA